MIQNRFLRRVIAAAIALLASIALSGVAQAQQCTKDCVTPGTRTVSGQYGGAQRSFKLFVPDGYTGRKSVALVLDLHGYGSNAEQESTASGQMARAKLDNFIVAWPQGLGNSWNGYGCCASSVLYNVNDVAFLREVIRLVKQYAFIDPKRVYVTGISNGGLMAHRMACEAADVVSAVVTVSFPLNRASCRPGRGITVYSIAGTADNVIRYQGVGNVDNGTYNFFGAAEKYQSAPRSLAAWKANNNCTSNLTTRTLPGGAREDAYTTCDNAARTGLVTVENGPHVLYPDYYKEGDPNRPQFKIADYIWTNIFK